MDQIKPEQTSPPGQWQKGAEALAKFQAQHTGVAKGGQVLGGPRSGSKYATLLDILAIASKGAAFGLSHSCQARMLGTDLLIWREYLHHSSGEFIYTEHPIFVPAQGHSGQKQQEMGGGITYARKYCIQALYGLFADDGMDPDTISYEEKTESAPKPVAKPVATPEQQSQTVVVTPPQSANGTDARGNALRILKSDPELKAKYMAKFYPSATQMKASMLKPEHYAFIDELELNKKLAF